MSADAKKFLWIAVSIGAFVLVALIGALLFCGWRKPRVWVTILLLLTAGAVSLFDI